MTQRKTRQAGGGQQDGGLTLGIDLGTSSVKVCAVDADGIVVAEVSRSYKISSPTDGWREIDPELWWDAARAALAELLTASFAAGCAVACIGVTGQMHTLVPVGANGRAVRPALMWNDGRTVEMLPHVRARLLEAGATHAARMVSTGSPAINLLWLKEHEPESFAKLDTFLIGPDWIVFKLTGVRGTDFCEASTSSLFDVDAHCWSEGVRVALGLPAHIYPPVRGSLVVAGVVRGVADSPLAALEGVPVITGTGDNPAAAYPTGCLTEGATVLSLGTSCVLMAERSPADRDRPGKTILFSLDGEHTVDLVQGVVQSCGSTRSWLIERLFGTDFAKTDAAIDLGRSGAGELLFFPHMAGEKTLFADPTLRGALLGLMPETSRADLDLAVMEGIAYGVRELADAMGLLEAADTGIGGPRPIPIRVIGGGSKSDVWMQVLADVLGRPMRRMEGGGGAGYGAALLARRAVTGKEPRSAAVCGAVFEPYAAAHTRHERAYRRYKRLLAAVRSVYREDE